MQMLISILILINNLFITGKVTDEISGNPLEYAMVSIKGTDHGTYTDQNGIFRLDVSDHLEDTLLFYSLGYEKKLIPVKDYLKKGLTNISLEVMAFEIQEIVISETGCRKLRSGVIKGRSVGKYDYHLFKPGEYQDAIYISHPDGEKNYSINSVHVFFRHSSPDSIPIRIRIYKFDPETRQPGKDLLQNNYLVIPSKGFTLNMWGRWTETNIKKENLIFPKEGIIAAFDFIQDNKGPVIGLALERGDNVINFRGNFGQWVEMPKFEGNNIVPMIHVTLEVCE